jgi:hypothetical protein
VPHCVITFPTAVQGQNAYRKLREFRKLHEVAWDKNNPEYMKMNRKLRIKKIMNQRANTSADLAEVFRIQHVHGEKTTEAQLEQEQKVASFLDKRWEQIDALANAGQAKEKPTDNVRWLKGQVTSMDLKLKMKHNHNEADQKRLKAAKESLETRLRKMQYAIRKAEQFKHMQEDLKTKAASADEVDVEAKVEELKSQARVMQEALENPDPTRSKDDLKMDQELLAQHQSEISTLEEAFQAKKAAEARDHYIARSVLPQGLKQKPVKPYTLLGISVRWADMQDALYAKGQWPDLIEHEPLEINKARGEVLMLSAEEYEYQKSNEVGKIIEALYPPEGSQQISYEPVPEAPALKSSIASFLPTRSPFKSATA